MNTLVCSRIDYCSSLLTGLLKSRLSAIQSVLNAAARLIARLSRFTHISTYMTEILHWLPIASRIKFKVLLLVSKSQLGLAPSYLTDFMRKPMSSVSARPLRSTDRLDLFVPRVRIALAQCHAFAVTGPSSWNGLPPELSLCPVFPLHLVIFFLNVSFAHRASALKAPLDKPIL